MFIENRYVNRKFKRG